MIYVIALVVIGGVLSLLTWRDVGIVRNGYVRAGGLILIFLCTGKGMIWSFGGADASGRMSGGFGSSLVHIVLMLAAIMPSVPFVAGAFAEIISGSLLSMLAGSGGRVAPSYDQADTAMRRKDYAEAERLYRQFARKHRKDAGVQRRLFELYLTTERLDDALAQIRQIYGLAANPEDRYGAAFEWAEVLADRKRDVAGAMAILDMVLKTYPDHPSAAFARERLALLRQRETAAPAGDSGPRTR